MGFGAMEEEKKKNVRNLVVKMEKKLDAENIVNTKYEGQDFYHIREMARQKDKEEKEGGNKD